MTTPYLTREQARSVDVIAIEKFGIPGVVLMENAGRNSAFLIEQEYKRLGNQGTVLIACGTGNNGGDGFVIARHLHNSDIPVQLSLFGPEEHLSHDAAINYRIAQQMEIETLKVEPTCRIRNADQLLAHDSQPAISLCVDALLGTGAIGCPRPPMDGFITTVNQLNAFRIAVDTPTGLDCDTGRVSEVTFQANLTLTFVAMKTGFQAAAAKSVLGKIQVVDIGIPRQILEQVTNSTQSS